MIENTTKNEQKEKWHSAYEVHTSPGLNEECMGVLC